MTDVMVRPNQIVGFEPDKGEVTFLMFAMSEKVVNRRVLFINFPSTISRVLMGEENVDDFIKQTKLITEGMINRYAVTVDTTEIFEN